MAKRALENLEGAGIHHPVGEQDWACKIPSTVDSGYVKSETLWEWENLPLDPYNARSRQRHRDNGSAEMACDNGATRTIEEGLAQKLSSEVVRRSQAAHKLIVAPVFGQIKRARRLRKFFQRGLRKVAAQRLPLSLTDNVLKI